MGDKRGGRGAKMIVVKGYVCGGSCDNIMIKYENDT